MDRETSEKLLKLTLEFYETKARDFSLTRMKPNPGILKTFKWIGGKGSLLDAGCGDGRIARFMDNGVIEADFHTYVGVDMSPSMLAGARGARRRGRFIVKDISQKYWEKEILEEFGRFDQAVCFSTLHHIPGKEKRKNLLQGLSNLLKENGKLGISVWQFLHVKELAAKVLPWETVGLDGERVDENDLLISWGKEGESKRYVHHFTEAELVSLLEANGFAVESIFRSDGRTGDLGLYLLCLRH